MDVNIFPHEAYSFFYIYLSHFFNPTLFNNIIWHNWTGEYYGSDLQSMTALNWNIGIWENFYRIDCTWDANGGCVETRKNYTNGNWTNISRITEAYDDHGNFLQYLSELWSNNTWTIDWGYQFLLT